MTRFRFLRSWKTRLTVEHLLVPLLVGGVLTSGILFVYDQNDRLLFSNARYHSVLGLSAGTLRRGAHYDDVMRLALAQSVAPERLDGGLSHRARQRPARRRLVFGANVSVRNGGTNSPQVPRSLP